MKRPFLCQGKRRKANGRFLKRVYKLSPSPLEGRGEERALLPYRRFQYIVGAEATPLKQFSDGRIHTEEF